MSDRGEAARSDRPPLPRDSHRTQRVAAVRHPAPVVITPDYPDPPTGAQPPEPHHPAGPEAIAETQSGRARANSARDPFEGYGGRYASRPFALRLPDAIDLALRQMAAEARTHPLRIIDRILHDHLKQIGRLPPPDGA